MKFVESVRMAFNWDYEFTSLEFPFSGNPSGQAFIELECVKAKTELLNDPKNQTVIRLEYVKLEIGWIIEKISSTIYQRMYFSVPSPWTS